MNTASWRSVYSATVRAAEEIMVDEVARKLGRDPVWFRRASLNTARARAVLDTVAERGRACRSHLDGEEIQPCVTPMAECADRRVTTIEGLAKGGTLHPVQQVWLDEDVARRRSCASLPTRHGRGVRARRRGRSDRGRGTASRAG